MFGNTHVFLTIHFPTVARTFFFGRKNSRFFNYFPNDLTIQFGVWKNSRFFNYFVSRLWLLLFSVVEKLTCFQLFFTNDRIQKFCVWKNSRFFHYFVSLVFSLVRKTHVFSTIVRTYNFVFGKTHVFLNYFW